MNDMITVFGGQKHTVEFMPDEANPTGRKVEVFVRQPRIREMDEFVKRMTNIQRLCEFCTVFLIGGGATPVRQPCKDNQLDDLTDESLYSLHVVVQEVNGPRFDRWLKEQGAAVAKVKPLFKELGLLP